jgi:hypothetical protein
MAARQRQRDRSGHVDPFHQRRHRYEGVLRPLGLWEGFNKLPRPMQEAFWRRKLPDPTLHFDATFPSYGHLRKGLEQALRASTIVLNGSLIAVRDFLSIVIGMQMSVQGTRDFRGVPLDIVQFMREARACLSRCHEEHLPDVFWALVRDLSQVLAPHSRLDTRLLVASLDSQFCPTGKLAVKVLLSAMEPQVRRWVVDGVPRPLYRVGTTWGGTGARWISLEPGQLGPMHVHSELPIFVQSHALKQLRQRANLPKAAPYLEGWLAESLKAPNIVERQGADLLVEYRLKEMRVGYLIVTLLDDMAVVRTFKFLTMAGTTEARALRNRLGLTRDDIDWLRLSELSSFTHTDLRSDQRLRRIFSQCGCGHLFELDDADYAPSTQGYAAEIRRYLRIAA